VATRGSGDEGKGGGDDGKWRGREVVRNGDAMAA
jgi:hypothetical protein